MAPQHLDALADAAVAVGVANQTTATDHLLVGGQDLSVDQWRSQHGADFNRVCDALFTADDRSAGVPSGSGGKPASTVATVSSIAGLLAGAVVTLLSGLVKDGIDRRRLLAGQLGSAMTNLSTVWRDYTTARATVGETADIGPVRERRQDLVARLREVLDLHPGWHEPKAAEKLLTDELGVAALTGGGGAANATGPTTVDTGLAQLDREVLATVARLRHPVSHRRRRS